MGSVCGGGGVLGKGRGGESNTLWCSVGVDVLANKHALQSQSKMIENQYSSNLFLIPLAETNL